MFRVDLWLIYVDEFKWLGWFKGEEDEGGRGDGCWRLGFFLLVEVFRVWEFSNFVLASALRLLLVNISVVIAK